jgi:carboxyl-terminal processing protease
MPSRRRSYILVPVFIALCSIGAGIFSGNQVRAASSDDPLAQSAKSFTKIYDVVDQNFADPVKSETAIYQGAIPGMLRELDPHSSFFDPRTFKNMREEQSGHYFGIGMLVTTRNGKTIVSMPFTGSPAYKAGLHPGDVILEVNDKKTDNMNTTEVADLLKGAKGTPVQVKVGRDGAEQPLIFNLVRDEIPRYSVPDGFWIRPGIAYLKIDQFTETTSKEMDEKLKGLGENNIKGLVLDLRANPGGLLNEGIEVAGHFLKRNEVVVSLRGLHQPQKTYTARSDNGGREYPIVVLVNRLSASAAEIVSGALQDHDRAWILGENTFGKGLVQQVYPLSDNTGLALTTAHYYTPSGRLIQRDYSNISFLDYYYHTNLEIKNAQDVKMTDSGRTVYGGGGITPDEKYTPEKYNKFQIEVLRKYSLFNFSAKYFGSHKDIKLAKGWSPDEKVVNEFHDFLLGNKVEFSEADFTANHEWIKGELKREMYITGFNYDESRRVAVEQDEEVQKAIESLPKAKSLVDNAKKMMVQRLTNQTKDSARAAR